MVQKTKEEKTSLEIFTSSRLAIFAQAAWYMVATTAVIAGGSYLLDQQLGTSPTIFIIGLVLSYPAAQYLIYKKIKAFSHKKLEDNK